MANLPVVTLLTDFGHVDPFVGIMKGVILSCCPEAVLVDLSHEVPAFDILGASFLLQSAVRYFPPQAIHLAVVDPGVGGDRRPLAARIDGRLFVAPDNGLLTYPLAAGRLEALHVLAAERYRLTPVSATFHGRDIFAPAAGHLAAGVPLAELGPAAEDPVRLPLPEPQREAGGAIRGRVVWIDRFGNCITNLTAAELAAVAAAGQPAHVVLDRRRLPLVHAYEEAGPAGEGALLGSSGRLELFSRRGSLARRRGIAPGRPVLLRPGPAPGRGGRPR